MLWNVIDLEEEQALCHCLDASGIQASCLFRNLSRARRLATYLIDKGGSLDQKNLKILIETLKKPFPPDYPHRVFDDVTRMHFLYVCLFFRDDRTGREQLKRFTLPVANRYIEKLLLDALHLSEGTKMEKALLKRAILSALLTPLRQNVGSCFATAPAILIQSEQIERLLTDLYDLVMRCSLKRTFAGIENQVPISMSWGVGDLRKWVDFSRETVRVSLELQGALEEIGIECKSAPQGALTVEDFFKEVIYGHFCLDQKEVEAYRKRRGRQKIAFSKRTETLEHALGLEERARACFKGYTDHALLKTWEYTLASFSDYKVGFFRWNLYTSLGFDQKEEGGVASLIFQEVEGHLAQANQKTQKLQEDYHSALDQVNLTQSLLRQASSAQRIERLKGRLGACLSHAQGCKNLMNDAHEQASFFSSLFAFLLEKYADKFQEYFQEIYDPEMFGVSSSIYEDSPAGFCLLYKHGRKDPTLWTTIKGKEGYIWALVSFFNATEPMIVADCTWKAGGKAIQEITTVLIHHLQTEEFLASAFKRMAQRYGAKTKREKEEKKPWSYTSGGTMKTLLRCYYCSEKTLTKERREVDNPQDLLIFLLDTMKGLRYEVAKPFESNPCLSMLMESPTHAFLFKPGLAPFKAGWLDKGFTYTWVRDEVIDPARTFYAKFALDQTEQTDLANRFCDAFFKERAPQFKRAFTPHFKRRDLGAFRKDLLRQFKASPDQIDGFLWFVYPRPPLLFADTNWGEFYFGFVVNPGTLKLELWRLNLEGKGGFPMTSWDKWLDGSHNLPWVIYTNPQEYSGDHLPDLSWVKA